MLQKSPTNADELETLQSNPDLELQDYPMDYAVTQDGNYYQDPNIGTEDIPWLYTSVPVGYMSPVGIQYQVIAPNYIPETNLNLEAMAESLAGGATYTVTIQGNNRLITRSDADGGTLIVPNNAIECPPEYHTEPDAPRTCVPDNCPVGYYWNGTTCALITPPPPPPTSPTGIYVEDITNCAIASTNVPLRQARVVCKRWFKIWRGYTDDNGHFNCTKSFNNNVKVIVKTKNNNATIGKIRGVRLWQMLFPVTKRIGVFGGGSLSSVYYVFTKPTNANSTTKELPYWAAATTHNSVVEFKDYSSSTEFNLTQPVSDLRIFVTNWGDARGSGSTVMFNKCHDNTISQTWINFFIANTNLIPFSIGALATVLKNRVDMTISYLPRNADYNCVLTSPRLKSIVYHELGHAQHYTQVGCNFWTAYRTAIITEISKFDQPNLRPYGSGADASTAPIIALGEMWGNHCEYIYSNRRYGTGGAAASIFTVGMQGTVWGNPGTTTSGASTIAGLNAYLAALESHNPNNAGDVHR